MSRIGKHPVPVPQGVQVQLAGQTLTAKGPKGELKLTVVDDLSVELADGKITVKPRQATRRARAMWGMQRTLVSNLVNGVKDGYTRELEINGVGLRAAMQGKNLQLNMGFSHEVIYPIPAGIEIKVEKPTSIKISGADKHLVGQVAAEIRAVKPPEPYKGKGIKYSDETILRKEGKKK
ncbi:50S ribosomal protein L6 [uncultured Ferrovibrio sp.]|jgi:large subunit ribosomal protein L6|uniref:50S ribosomal protein L6 n=1 Tax=uncultured Ferrovibrio sp. TaxID=1576913 RepID=UPI002611CD5B|nr:50S ribosomal protein L6 [uncultured Ferrovibrio sp.]